ncbi:MAG: cysteine desulfurase [Candidatus Kapabacteria bacterium]|nr:cysteine desulfurase [Candidatus Kapabacteria bacterium]
MMTFNINKIRADFPILQTEVNGHPLVYLDNAASTQKPQVVIDSITKYYTEQNSNIHRGVHHLSELATKLYENARKTIAKFISADPKEIIYTRGATESINLVVSTYGRKFIGEGDEIIITEMEHHSNIVPWQMLCEEKGAKLRILRMNDNGEISIDNFKEMLNEKTKFVSIVHISNSLGTINPVKEMIDLTHEAGAVFLLDGAQSIQHVAVDVKALDCDFFVVSGHKLYGPTGIGFLYGKKEFLEAMPPYQGGGDMILSVNFEKTVFNEVPYKFEAGTPNIAGAVGLAEAIKYIDGIGIDKIAAYETELLDYATAVVADIPELRIIGTAANKTSVLSFVLSNVHPHDIGTFLNADGVAIRTGHHCTEPVMHKFKIPATSRASISFYNTKEEIDVFVASVKKVIKMFS